MEDPKPVYKDGVLIGYTYDGKSMTAVKEGAKEVFKDKKFIGITYDGKSMEPLSDMSVNKSGNLVDAGKALSAGAEFEPPVPSFASQVQKNAPVKKELPAQPKDRPTHLKPTGRVSDGIPTVTVDAESTGAINPILPIGDKQPYDIHTKEEVQTGDVSAAAAKAAEFEAKPFVIDPKDPMKSMLSPFQDDLSKQMDLMRQDMDLGFPGARADATVVKKPADFKPAGKVTVKDDFDTKKFMGAAAKYNEKKQYIEANMFKSGLDAKEYINEYYKTQGELPQDNWTLQEAAKRVRVYDEKVKGLEKYEATPEQALRLYSLDQWKALDPLAAEKIRIIEAQHPNETPETLNYDKVIGNAPMGRAVARTLADTDIEAYVNSDTRNKFGGTTNLYKEHYDKLKENFFDEYPEYGINIVANKISRARQQMGLNNAIANFAGGSFNSNTDNLATVMFKDDPQSMMIYDKYIKDHKKKYIDVPGFLNRLEGGIEKQIHGLGETFAKPQSTEQQIQKSFKDEFQVSAGETGLAKTLGQMGDMTGYVMSMVATGTGFKGVAGLAEGVSGTAIPAWVAERSATAATFWGDNYKAGVNKYPGEPNKAFASAILNTAGFVVLPDIFPTKKIGKAIDIMNREVDASIKALDDKELTEAAMRDIGSNAVKKVFEYGKEFATQHGKSVAEMLALTKFNQITDKALGMTGDKYQYFHPDSEDIEVVKSMAIANVLPSAVAAYGSYAQREFTKNAIWDYKQNPTRALGAFTLTGESLNMTDAQKTDLQGKLRHIISTGVVLDDNNVSEKNQKTYLLHSLNEKQLIKEKEALMNKAADIENETLRKNEEAKIEKIQTQIDQSKKIQESILKTGDAKERDRLPQDSAEKPIFSDFDDSISDKSGKLLPHGEDIKKRIAAGEDVTIVTSSKDEEGQTEGANRERILKSLGLDSQPDNLMIYEGLDASTKARLAKEGGGILIDNNQENLDAAKELGVETKDSNEINKPLSADQQLFNQVKEKADEGYKYALQAAENKGDIGKGLEYMQDKFSENPVKFREDFGDDIADKILERTPTKKLKESIDYLIDKVPDDPSIPVLDKIIEQRDASQSKPVEETTMPTELEFKNAAKENPITSKMDAETRLSNGDRIFGFHEMDENLGEPIEIKNVGELKSFNEDQLIAIPRKENPFVPQPKQVSSGGVFKEGRHELELSDFHDNHEQIIKNNPNATITLYHGSAKEISELKSDKPIYFSPDISNASEYRVGNLEKDINPEEGHVYKVKIPLRDIKVVENIDSGLRDDTHKVVYDPVNEKYFRIDNPKNLKLEKVSEKELNEKWDNGKAEIEQPQQVSSTEGGEGARVVTENTWHRGINKNNQDQGDRFYSADESTAHDYAINKVGEEPTMTTLAKEEQPKNPLVVGSKEDLAATIGFPEDKIFDLDGDFDKKAKEYAQSKGHDAIVYESGSMDEPEMHIFEKKAGAAVITPAEVKKVQDTPIIPFKKVEEDGNKEDGGKGGEPPPDDKKPTGEEKPIGIPISKGGMKALFGHDWEKLTRDDQLVFSEAMKRVKSNAEKNGRSLESQLAKEVDDMRAIPDGPEPNEHNIMVAGSRLMDIHNQLNDAIAQNNTQMIDLLSVQRQQVADLIRVMSNKAGRNLRLFSLVFSKSDDGERTVVQNRIKSILGVNKMFDNVADLDKSDLTAEEKDKVRPYVEELEQIKKDRDGYIDAEGNKVMGWKEELETELKKNDAEDLKKKIDEAREQGRREAEKGMTGGSKTRKAKTSQKLKDFASDLRRQAEREKFDKGPGGDLTTMGPSGSLKEIAATILEGLAEILDTVENVSDYIKDTVGKLSGLSEQQKNDVEGIVNTAAARSTLPISKEDAIEKIRVMSDAVPGMTKGSTVITEDMVNQGLVRAVVMDHIMSDVPSERVIEEAHNDLKKVLPDVSRDNVADAFARRNQFALPTKQNLQNLIKEKISESKAINIKQIRVRALEAADQYHAADVKDKARIKGEVEKQLDERIKELTKKKTEGVSTDKEGKPFRSRLDMAKDAIRKRIEAIRTEIADKERKAKKEKLPLHEDIELHRLKEVEKALSGLRDRYLPEDPKKYVEEKALKQRRQSLINEIDSLNEQINSGQRKEGKDKIEDTEEIKTFREIKKQKESLLDEVAPDYEKLQKQQAAEQERIDKIQQEIDFVNKEKKVFQQAIGNKKQASKDFIAAREAMDEAYTKAGIRKETQERQPIRIEREYQAAVEKAKSELSGKELDDRLKELKSQRNEDLKVTHTGVLALVSDAMEDFINENKERIDDPVIKKVADIRKIIDLSGENLSDQTDKVYTELTKLIDKDETLSKEDREALKQIRQDFENNNQVTADKLAEQRIQKQYERDIRTNERKLNSGLYTEIPTTAYDFRRSELLQVMERERKNSSQRLSKLVDQAKGSQRTISDKIARMSTKILVSGFPTVMKVAEAATLKPIIDSLVESTFGRLAGKITDAPHTTMKAIQEGFATWGRFKTEAAKLAHIEKMAANKETALNNLKSAQEGGDKKEIKKAEEAFKVADMKNGIAAIYHSIDANTLKTFKEYLVSNSTDYDENIGKGIKDDIKNYRTGMAKVGYVLDGWIRLHGALKAGVSARPEVMRSYVSTLQKFVREGRELTPENLALAQTIAAMDYEYGRLTNPTILSQGITKLKYNSRSPVVRGFGHFLFPVSTIAINIAKRGLDYSTLGVEGWIKLGKGIKEGIKLNTVEGKEYDTWMKKVQDGMSRMPLRQRKYIASVIGRGMAGVALWGLSYWGLANGQVKYGGTWDDRNKRKIIGSNGKELRPGEWEWFGWRMPHWMNILVDHTPEFMTVRFAANQYQINKLDKGEGSELKDAVDADFQEVMNSLPFMTMAGLFKDPSQTLIDRFTRVPIAQSFEGIFDPQSGNKEEMTESRREHRTPLEKILYNLGADFMNPAMTGQNFKTATSIRRNAGKAINALQKAGRNDEAERVKKLRDEEIKKLYK